MPSFHPSRMTGGGDDKCDTATPSGAAARVECSAARPSTAAVKYARQAEKLSLVAPDTDEGSGTAVAADFITPQDAVIITGDGGRLPGVPLVEATKLNVLKAEVNGEPLHPSLTNEKGGTSLAEKDSGPSQGAGEPENGTKDEATIQVSGEGSLRRAMPPSRTHPLFPPLPLYGPSSFLREIQSLTFRTTSFFLSLAFLGIIVLGSAFTSIPLIAGYIWLWITFRDPDTRRPFYEEEKRRQKMRREEERAWKKQSSRRNSRTQLDPDNEDEAAWGDFVPTEGGPDRLVCDVGYYARRVGLDVEEFKVQTEDGFLINLWHVYNPHEYSARSVAARAARGPSIFTGAVPSGTSGSASKGGKFPVLLIHGLLQSGGAFCVNDDDSLAFYLCKSG
jgi:hypothetical protein